jgi:hypothetical protein
MLYFDNFDKITFDGKRVTNILKRVDLFNQIKNNAAIYDFLKIQDGETPEDLALLIYGNSNLFWIILWANNIIDTHLEWPMTDAQLLTVMQEKYGEENVYNTHHYETTDQSDLGAGVIVNQGTPFSVEVSNYTFEHRENEKKRKIRIINKAYVSQIIDEFTRVLA